MAHFKLLGYSFTTEELTERAEQLGHFHNLIGYYPDSVIEEIADEYVDAYITDEDKHRLDEHTHGHRILLDDVAQYLADCYLEDIGNDEDFNGETL